MAVDDGIAMGHTGMLYSPALRDIIADTVEYHPCNRTVPTPLVCILELRLGRAGMLMAAPAPQHPDRVRLPVARVEAPRCRSPMRHRQSIDLIDVM